MDTDEARNFIELQTRKVLSEEAAGYREHLESQLGHLKWSVAIILGFITALFAFFFGKTWIEAEAALSSIVNDVAIAARINEKIVEAGNEAIQRVEGRFESQLGERLDALEPDILAQVQTISGNVISTEISQQVNRQLSELSIPDLSNIQGTIPVGTVIASMLEPEEFRKNANVGGSDWRLANGQRITGTTYAELTGGDTLPDLRGMFLRGLNEGRSDGLQDPEGDGRQPGAFQPDEVFSHGHGFSWYVGSLQFTLPNNYPVLPNGYYPDANQGAGAAVRPFGGAETRPRNSSVYWYIRVN